jgi:hypothetical protein
LRLRYFILSDDRIVLVDPSAFTIVYIIAGAVGAQQRWRPRTGREIA